MADDPDLRIVHVLGGRGGVGGAERVLTAIVQGSPSFDHHVLLPFARPDAGDDLLRAFAGTPVSFGGADRLVRSVWVRRWVDQELRRLKADVVHAHLFHASVLVASLPREIPRILTHHHGSLFRDQGRPVHLRLDRWAGTRYDRLVAVSHAVAEFLVAEYRYPRDCIEVVHNGWLGSPQPRASTGVDFLTVGNLRREKGHDVLLEAFAVVRKQDPAARLRLLGDGPLRSELQLRAADLGLSDGVEFVGAVDDVWTHLAEARVTVVPSWTETQGIAVLEALAAGCPVVATRVGGIPEMIEHGRNGHLVPPGEPLALAEAMVRVRRDAPLRERYSAEGSRTAKRWRMDTTVRRYEALYREVVQPSGAEPHPS